MHSSSKIRALGLFNLLSRCLDQLVSHPSEPIADVGNPVPPTTDRDHEIRFLSLQFQELLCGQRLASILEHDAEHLDAGFIHTQHQIITQKIVRDLQVVPGEEPASGYVFPAAV